MPQSIGLFATLTHCLLLCKFCLEEDFFPIFSIENDLYGRNWFDRFFRHRAIPTAADGELKSILITDRLEINAVTRGAKEREISDELTSISEGARLFHRFLGIKEEIRQLLDADAARLISEGMVGVHYRGTDKFVLESLPVAYSDVLEATERAADAKRPIYLASDDPDFFEFMAAHTPPGRLTYARRPAGPSHYIEAGTFQKGLEALTDAWLLSRCSLLVKTPSLLSAWSVIFNPAIPVILVGAPKRKPYPEDHALRDGIGYFPENILHRRTAESVVPLGPSDQPPTA